MPSWSDFQRLPLPPAASENEPEVFAAAPTAGQHWLARDHRGCASLMVVAPASTTARRELRLECLQVHFALRCEIRPAARKHANITTLTVLRCTSLIEDHQRLFVSLLDTVIAAVGQPATSAKLHAVIQQLAVIFSSLSQPARTTIQGLWGELLVITLARDTERLFRSWHATVSDDFDFSDGVERIEVKTTSSRKREHMFSLEQLRPPEGTVAQVASLIVRPAGGGVSVADLTAEIETRIDHDLELRLKLHVLIVQTLGVEWAHSAKWRFDRELAAGSLAFFNSASIPQFVEELPLGVSRVSFCSDLSSVPQAASPKRGTLFYLASPLKPAAVRGRRSAHSS